MKLWSLLLMICAVGCQTNSRMVKTLIPLNIERAAENNSAAIHANSRAQAAVVSAQTVLAVAGVANERGIAYPSNTVAISRYNLTQAERAGNLTGSLLERNIPLIGAPATNQVARVDALLSDDASQQSLAVKREELLAQAEARQVAQLRQAESRLVELGQFYEKEKAQSAWRRVWAWSISVFGIGGVIAICVFFPAVIPILGSILGWIVSAVPSVAKWIGLVSVKAYERSVAAFQEAKRHAAKAGDVTTLKMLRQTAAENTGPDEKLVKYVKQKAGYVKSETTPQM